MVSYLGAKPLSLSFTSHYLKFENADFSDYDETKYKRNQAVSTRNTDDTFHLLYSDIRFRYNAQYKNSEFFLGLDRYAFWGADNLQGRTKENNQIQFHHIYFTYFPNQKSKLKCGRFRYEIGDSIWDTFFSDTIDGLTYSYFLWENTQLSFLGDILSNSVDNAEVGLYSSIEKDEESIESFRGDTVSQRVGVNLKQSFLDKKLGLRFFAYQVQYGANKRGGADEAENGRNSYNQADGDFLNLGGFRFYGKNLKEALDFDISYAYSYGIDKQFAKKHVYNDSALAFNLLWYSNPKNKEKAKKVWLSLGHFQENYVGMKGRSMGGPLLWAYKGYSVSPYASFYHFHDYGKREGALQYIDRTNSKRYIKLQTEFLWSNWATKLSALALWESKSNEKMGSEYEWSWSYRIDNIKFSHTSAIFYPTRYYQKRAIGDGGQAPNHFLPYGKDPFYVFRFSLEYILDLSFVHSQKKEDRTLKIWEAKKKWENED